MPATNATVSTSVSNISRIINIARTTDLRRTEIVAHLMGKKLRDANWITCVRHIIHSVCVVVRTSTVDTGAANGTASIAVAFQSCAAKELSNVSMNILAIRHPIISEEVQKTIATFTSRLVEGDASSICDGLQVKDVRNLKLTGRAVQLAVFPSSHLHGSVLAWQCFS